MTAEIPALIPQPGHPAGSGYLDRLVGDFEREANDIENRAAQSSYECGLGASEWEAFLGDSGDRLAELARLGFGTWARESYIPAPFNISNSDSAT